MLPTRRPFGLLALLVAARLAFPPVAQAESAFPMTPAGGSHGGVDEVRALERVKVEARANATRVKRGELEQTVVIPQRPGKNNVRYYDFDWHRYDFLGDRGVGGVRFYFYEREAEVARIAAALVREQYEMLANRFNYRPTQQVPYILYNSHREFQNTNVFFVSEGVLGVTSPLDLRMALPFWGEVERFREVSTHEMVHQFQIQKMAERAAALGMESTIQQLPLWFIEGLAEYYAKNGVDLEADLFARDLLLNTRPDVGYVLIGFWDDFPQGYIYTYKLGQLRVAFLAEHYGERVVQAVLDQSPRLAVPGRNQNAAAATGERESFQELLSRLAGERPEAIAQRFSAWLRRRYLPAYLRTQQEPPAIAPLDLPGEPDSFVTAGEGYVVLYRSVERETGRSRLMLADRRNAPEAVQVAVDGVPGIESLHPVLRNVTALGSRAAAFLARDGKADSLYVVPYTRTGAGRQAGVTIGELQKIELAPYDIVEAGDPAFSPDGARVAFSALDTTGRVDIYVADLASSRVERLTNDLDAERDLTWSVDPPLGFGVPAPPSRGGTLLFASDATADRHFNLFALDPATRARARLTDEPADHRGPLAIGGGQVFFSTDARGKPDLHLLDVPRKRITRLTDFVTALTQPAAGPRGLMALGFFGGQYRVFDIPEKQLLDLDARASLPERSVPPAPLAAEPISLEDTPGYDPYARENWRLENGVGAVGSAGVAVAQGALLFADVLSDRNLITQFAVRGSLSLTDAYLFFLDRSGRDALGAGVFHTVLPRIDLDAPGFNRDVSYFQQEFGATGLWSKPFDAFTRLELRLTANGIVRNFQQPLTARGLGTTAVDVGALRTWLADRGAVDLDSVFTVRFGYDTTRFRFPSGAFGGGSFLAEAGAGVLPLRQYPYGFATIDGQYHLPVLGSSALHLRLASGLASGVTFGRQFLLSSFDNLRNYSWGDPRLLGTLYAVTNADWEIPLDSLVRLAIFSTVEGVVGLDFGAVSGRRGGSVGGNLRELWDNRTLAFVLGGNFGLGPFEIRMHWALPIDIGGYVQPDVWVPNVSLRYAYF